MINYVWLAMIAVGILSAALKGDPGVITSATVSGAEQAVKLALELVGLIAFWSGLIRIAEAGGLTGAMARAMRPLVRRLFPDVPSESPALGALLMSISANMMGLGNAATPIGLRAMAELQKLNRRKDTASDAMCTFLALCTSSLTLIPTGIISVRAAAGSANPAEIVGTVLFATIVSTTVALLTNALFRNLYSRKRGAGKGGRRP